MGTRKSILLTTQSFLPAHSTEASQAKLKRYLESDEVNIVESSSPRYGNSAELTTAKNNPQKHTWFPRKLWFSPLKGSSNFKFFRSHQSSEHCVWGLFFVLIGAHRGHRDLATKIQAWLIWRKKKEQSIMASTFCADEPTYASKSSEASFFFFLAYLASLFLDTVCYRKSK